MTVELVTCTACGTKNDSHRTVCLRCGHNLGRTEDKINEPTDEVLIEKARALAPALIGLARAGVDSLFKQLRKEVAVDIRGVVYLEMVIFYLHLVSRFALQFLGAEKRSTFVDVLLIEVRELLSRTFESGLEAEPFRNGFATPWNAREIEYGNYKFFPEKGEPSKDTLFWEFPKKIAAMVGSENNALVILHVYNWAFCSIDPILKGIPL